MNNHNRDQKKIQPTQTNSQQQKSDLNMPQQQQTSPNNLKRIESVVNSILEDVEKVKNNSLYSEDIPEVEAALSAVTRGNQNLKRIVIAKEDDEKAPRSTKRIAKNLSKLAALVESIDISPADSEHLLSAINITSKDLSSHINVLKRKSEKGSKFSF